MPRNGSGVFSPPVGTFATPNTTIESAKYNAFVQDVADDLNLARPIVAGGTGAATALGAVDGLGISMRDNCAAILADTVLTYAAGQPSTVTAGDVVQARAERFSYTVAASAASDHHVTTAGGVKLYVVSNGAVNVKAFGAVGDGTTDDTGAFQKALAVGGYVMAPKATYRLSGLLTVGTATLDLMGSTLNVAGSSQVFTVAGGAVLGGIIDGLGGDHTAYPSEILPSTGSKIVGVTYQNFAGLLATTQTYPIKLPMWGAFDFVIERVAFKNITQQDNGAVAGAGFVGGIYFTSPSLDTQANVSRGVVRDIYGQDVKSVTSGSGVAQDADLIRSYYSGADDLSALNWPLHFENITGRNVGKRIMKLGAMNGGTINGVWCLKDDGATEQMYSALSISGNRWKISNINIAGEVERGLEVTGEDCVVNGVVYSTTSSSASCYAVLLGSSVGVARRCLVYGLDTTNASAAVYFYDSFDSIVNGVICRGTTNSLVVRTFNASTGNSNTLLNVVSDNAGLLLDAGATLNVFNFAIKGFTQTSTPFSVVNGNLKARGVSIISSIGRRLMNIAPLSGQTIDLDDVTLTRASDASSYSTNNYSLFTTVDANAGAFLKIGSIRIVANHNNPGTAASNAGRAHFRIANLNYRIGTLTVVNNFARGEVGQDIYIDSSTGKCSIGTLEEIQDIAGGNLTIVAPTSGKLTIRHLELDNAFPSAIAAYIGTIFARGGATVTGALNTPTTITV